jgi:tripartite-type tricarboxylate transporter receptor subunit TctC
MYLAPATLHAQTYPTKPIRVIVPFAPGGGVDFVARVVGQKLGERLGQQFAIDNRAGANGIVGLQALMAAAPDGYTLSAVSAGPLAVNPSIYAKLPYDPMKDFTHIANMINFPLMMVVHPSMPVKSVKDVIALARGKPGVMTYSHPGAGNSSHLAGELFNAMAKVDIAAIPYKGTAPSTIAVLAGETQITYSSLPPALSHVRANRLRALGICAAKRIAILPEYPTISESGLPGYEAYAWGAMVGPAGMSADIVQRLNREIVSIINTKEMIDRFHADGTLPTPSSPEELTAYLRVEIKKWGDVVRLAKIKAE